MPVAIPLQFDLGKIYLGKKLTEWYHFLFAGFLHFLTMIVLLLQVKTVALFRKKLISEEESTLFLLAIG